MLGAGSGVAGELSVLRSIVVRADLRNGFETIASREPHRQLSVLAPAMNAARRRRPSSRIDGIGKPRICRSGGIGMRRARHHRPATHLHPYCIGQKSRPESMGHAAPMRSVTATGDVATGATGQGAHRRGTPRVRQQQGT